MNTANIQKVIDAIKAAKWIPGGYPAYRIKPANGMPKGFNMAHYVANHDCGSVCCIAGFTAHLATDVECVNSYRIFSIARECLELDEDTALELFTPNEELTGVPWKDIPKRAAIACLEHLLETGKVDWARAMNQ